MQAKTDDVQAMGRKTGWRHDIAMNKGLYLLSIPIIAFFLIFNYAPMAGLVIAFQDFKPQRGILGSQWVAFDNFVDFFTNPSFASILATRWSSACWVWSLPTRWPSSSPFS